jgi:NADH dehydrogenase
MILVTGGTGFVGQEVVAKLLELGHRVRLLVRNPARANRWAHDSRVELVQGDVLKPETLPEAVKGVQAVIHLVGIIAETSRVTYEQAHRDATRNLLAAAKGAGVTRWVQMSAIGTRPHASSRYHQTKWAAEELVRNSGLDWTILRPSLVYGYDERDRLLNLLRLVLSPPLNFLQLYSFPLLNGGESLIQPVSVREVALCFALAPAKEASIGRTFDLVGPVAFSWREMIFKVLHALGKKGLYEQIPLLLMIRALLWLGLVVVPCLLLASAIMGQIDAPVAEVATGLWIIFFLVALRWRQVIVFNIPGEPLVLGSELLNGFAPRELRPSEMLKMAVEDNAGDIGPTVQTFAYQPETFEQGLAKIYR